MVELVTRRTVQHALVRMGLAGVLIAGWGPGRAMAAPAPSEPAAATVGGPTPIYVVRAAGTDPELLAALEAARARLEGRGVALTVATARPDETAAGRARALVAGGLARGVFWFDESTPGELRVFMLAADGSAWVRRVPVEPETAEATREAVWLIVESTGLALAAGQEVAMEQADEVLAQAEAPRPTAEPASASTRTVEPEPSEPAATKHGPTFGIGLAYLGDGLATKVPWQSGAGITISADLEARWRVVLGYGLLLPWRGGDPPVSWRQRVELRAGPRVGLGQRLEVYGLVGGALELLRWQASDGDRGGMRALGVATLDVGLGVRLGANVWLVLEPGFGMVANRFDFVECAAGASRCDGTLERVVLEPWRIRPHARVGFVARF